MKKILIALLIVIYLFNFSVIFAQESCSTTQQYGRQLGNKCCNEGGAGTVYDYDTITKNFAKCCPVGSSIFDKDTGEDVLSWSDAKNEPSGSTVDNNYDCCNGEIYNKDVNEDGPSNYACCEKGNIIINGSCVEGCDKYQEEVDSRVAKSLDGPLSDRQNDKYDEAMWELEGCKINPQCVKEYLAVKLVLVDKDSTKAELDEVNKDLDLCNNPTNSEDTPSSSSSSTAAGGIECTIEQLTYGQCKFNIYDTLGIRESVRSEGDPTSVGLFVQDIVLSATMFIGTIVTIALVVSGLMFVFAGVDSGMKQKAKNGIINAIIGLVIVASSYAIIRLVQFIARGA